MKAERTTPKEKFQQITIEITLETPKEAKALYHLFNHVDIRSLAKSLDGDAIKNAIGEEFYDEDFHNKLCDKIRQELKQ